MEEYILLLLLLTSVFMFASTQQNNKYKKTAAADDTVQPIEYNTNFFPGVDNQCFEYGNYYFYIDTDSVKNANAKSKFKPVTIDSDNNIKLDDKSSYTWIYGTTNGIPKLFLTKCITINEATNKHSIILSNVVKEHNNFELRGAGELSTDYEFYDTYMINSLSGSYMHGLNERRQNNILQEVKSLLQTNENTVFIKSVTNGTFINAENTPYTRESLEELLDSGITFKVYGTPQECKEASQYKKKLAREMAKYDVSLNIWKKCGNLTEKPERPSLKPPEYIPINNKYDLYKLLSKITTIVKE